jgi:hypothetical protein
MTLNYCLFSRNFALVCYDLQNYRTLGKMLRNK